MSVRYRRSPSASGWRESLRLLATRDRDVEERQRTLDATIAWSYELLDTDEQRVLRALSVFAGGCTMAAAHAVAAADLDSLESLLDKSLIRHRIDETGHDRYWILETIREYAARELHGNGEALEVGARHTAFFVDLAGELWRLSADRPPMNNAIDSSATAQTSAKLTHVR